MNTTTLSQHGGIAGRRRPHYGHMQPMSLSCGSRTSAWAKRPSSRASSGRLAALGGSRHSQKEAGPLGAQPLPQFLEFQSRPFPPPLTMQAQTSSRISSATRSDRKTASRRRGSGGCSSPTKGSRTAARPPCGPTPRVTAPMAPAGPSTSTRLATSPRRLGGTRLQAMCTSSLLWGRPARGQRGPETADWPRLARRNSRQPRARSDARQEQPPGS